ncbi:hypothetical protein Ssi02_28570 [Sinosporangium siamense]|uniref:Uncharacterized protein n=1 Tax=Sinosporangium siamense TaxID=1367973 RepID=A0A919V721_9ACTN|nr:hypothetical protein Ssi02_28570 [Sinosporangium siamense]
MNSATGTATMAATSVLRPLVRRKPLSDSRTASLTALIRCREGIAGACVGGGVGHRAVAEEHHPVRPRRVTCLVGDEEYGGPRVAASAQQAEDLVAAHGVEGAGGLVGKQQAALPQQGPGDGDTLPLAAGDLVGVARGDVRETHLLQCRHGLFSGGGRTRAVEFAGKHDVLDRAQGGDEVEVLEHIADVPAAQRHAFRGRQGGQLHVLDGHRARGGAVESARDVEQRGLARSRRSHHGEELPRLRREAHLSQRVHSRLPRAVHTGDRVEP